MSKLKTVTVALLALATTTGGGAIGWHALSGQVAAGSATFAAAAEKPSQPPKPDKPPAQAKESQSALDPFARRIWTIMEVVSKQHLEPCPREQMIVGGTTALFKAAKVKPPANIVRRAANLETPEQFATFLREIWPKGADVPRNNDLTAAFLQGVLASVPGRLQLASIPDPKEQKVHEQISGNRYVGMGIQIRTNPEIDRPQIVATERRGVARKAGIKANDIIEQVDGKDTRGITVSKAVEWLRGEDGTSVSVVVRQPGAAESRLYKLTRAVVPFDHIFGYRRAAEDAWDFRPAAGEPIAYLRISSHVSSTLHELRQVERRLLAHGFRALVIDLRFGAGGSLQHVALTADGLLDGGLMWQVKGRGEQSATEFRADRECLFRDWPLVVLIDENVSRLDAMLAAALQDNGRAVLVGSPAKTDDYLASAVELPGEKTVLVLPTGRIERPNKERGWPVKPDHLVSMGAKQRESIWDWFYAQDKAEQPTGAEPPPDPQLGRAVDVLREALKKAENPKNP